MALRVEGGRRYGAMNAAARGISEMALGWSGMAEGRQPRRKIDREARILLFEGCPGSSGLLRGVLHYLWPPSIIVQQVGPSRTPH